MNKNQTRTFALEHLEDRLAPAINAVVSPSGLLSIRGFSSTGLVTLATTANPGEIAISDGISTTTATGVQSINVALNGAPVGQNISVIDPFGTGINGNVTIDAGTHPSNTVIFLANPPDGIPDIVGSLTISRALNISVNGDVGGNVTLNNSTYPAQNNFYTLTGSTLGNLSVSGSIYSDGIALTNFDVSGNARFSMSQSFGLVPANTLTIDNSSIISGSLSITGGNGSNSVGLSGVVNGFATIGLGNGANTVDFASTGLVGRSLSISLGRGNAGGGGNQIGLGADGFAGTINGNLTISSAGGRNQIRLGATVHGPQTTIALGRGTNTLTFAGTLDITSGRMLVNMIRGGTNVFDPNGVAVTWPFRIYF